MATLIKYAGSSSDVQYSGNTVNVWNNLFNVLDAQDMTLYSDCTIPLLSADGPYSDYLQVFNFGYNLPNDAQIVGIVARVYGYSLNGSIADYSIQIMQAGVATGTDKSVGAYWDTVDNIYTYGSLTDQWGLNWTAADINNSGFGLQIQVINNNYDATSDTAYADAVAMQVAYFQEDGVKRIISIIKML